MRELVLEIALDNKQEIAFYRKPFRVEDSYSASLYDEDGEEIAAAELDESTFKKINVYHSEITGELEHIALIDGRNKLGNFPPNIIEEQAIVVNWAKGVRKNEISFSEIIEFLVSDKKPNSDLLEIGLEEARTIYKRYNSNWKNLLLKALMLDSYRFENDIKEGQRVTNGELIGFAFYVDYEDRKFNLYSSKSKHLHYFIERFQIDEFYQC